MDAVPNTSSGKLELPSKVGARLSRCARPLRIRFACGARAAVAGSILAFAACCGAAELRIAAPNAVKEVVSEVAAAYGQRSGHSVLFTWSGSEAISKRVGEGEVFDLIVNTAQGIDRLAREGKLVADSRTDFARSGVGIAVRAGAPRPDVSSVDGLRQGLLEAGSIAISSGASGRYLEGLFQQLGVADQVRPRIKQPPSGAQIGEMLARGEADLGFQQVTELIHTSGIDYLGPLPAPVQNYTVWSAAVHAAAPLPDAALELVRLLRGPDSLPSIRKSGMDPM
jgi:molybdate transport system substrate-binding protein